MHQPWGIQHFDQWALDAFPGEDAMNFETPGLHV
jgi:hypothetical protein